MRKGMRWPMLGCLLAALIVSVGEGGDQWRPTGDAFPSEDDSSRRRDVERAGRIELAEVTATAGDYTEITVWRLGMDGKEMSMPLRSGDRILAGDRIVVGKTGRLEFFMGLNARVLVPQGTEVAALAQETSVSNGVTTTRRHLRLSGGSLRARVRSNITNPEPVSIHFGESVLEIGNPSENGLGGTDGVVVMHDKKRADVTLIHGKATLRTEVLAGDGGKRTHLVGAQQCLLNGTNARTVKCQDLDATALLAIRKRDRFSIDQFPDEVQTFDFYPDAVHGP